MPPAAPAIGPIGSALGMQPTTSAGGSVGKRVANGQGRRAVVRAEGEPLAIPARGLVDRTAGGPGHTGWSAAPPVGRWQPDQQAGSAAPKAGHRRSRREAPAGAPVQRADGRRAGGPTGGSAGVPVGRDEGGPPAAPVSGLVDSTAGGYGRTGWSVAPPAG